jgi:tRNA(adenine34) deaminase
VDNKHLVKETDRLWMRLALEEARQAFDLGEVPVGAVAVLNGQVIASGFNCKESKQDPTAHAELLTLRRAANSLNNWRLLNVTLYSTLEPCAMCAGAMIQARLSRLVYGAKDIRFGANGSILDILTEPLFNHHLEVSSGVLETEAAELLQHFFRQLRQRDEGP